MAEEKVEPPNEKIGWKENPALRERDDYDNNLPFYELRVYDNIFLKIVLGTISFLGGEIILKTLFVGENSDKTPNRIHFLKLENGDWIRSVLNGVCDMNLESKEGEAAILKVIITIQTKNGFQTRTLIKRIDI